MKGLVGIRGAAQADGDTPEAIDGATRAILEAIVDRNRIDPRQVVATWFTQTPDLTTVYPAASARRMGWEHVPMMCAQEASVDGALPRTIRALVFAEIDEGRDVRHAYLGAARSLRPDLNEREGRVER